MEKTVIFCPLCGMRHEVEYHTRTVCIEGVESTEEYYLCTLTKDPENEVITGDLLARNIARHKDAREKAGLPREF